MTQPIRTAIFGTSWWADGAHLPGLRARPDVDVAALFGRDPERLHRLAAKFGVPREYTDYHRLLAEVRPEVVVVVTPNDVHAGMTLAALEAGAHVICEKPLALTAAEAARMLERAEQLGRRHMTFFTYRGLAGPRYIKRLLDEGYIGKLYHAQACYLHGSWLDPNRPAGWKTTLARGGSGVLGDLGAHVIDLLQWWLGPVSRATGDLQTFIAERPTPDGGRAAVETDDAAAFVMQFASGGQAVAQVSRLAQARKNYQRFELYGSDGMLVYDYEKSPERGGQVWGARAGGGAPKLLPVPADLLEGFPGDASFPQVYAALTDDFFASLRGGGPTPSPNFADGLAAQRVIETVVRSARSGAWETV